VIGLGGEQRASGAQVAGALAIVYVVWGSTYLAIKIAVDTLPPFLMAAGRFLLAGVLLWAWTARPGRAGGRPARATRAQWIAAAVSGILMLVGGNGAVTWAEQRIDSGIAALLVASVPLWMALLQWLREGDRPGWVTVAGLLLGFVGVGLLVRPDGAGTDLVAGVVVLLGALAWAWGSLYTRRAPLHPDPLRAAAMQMLAGAAAFIVVGVAWGEPARLDLAGASLASVSAVAYLAVFGSLVAFTAYSWLLRNTSASTVSTYAYVNPVVAVILGALVLAEPVTSSTLWSGALIVAGVALIVSGGRRKPADAPATVATPAVAGDRRARLRRVTSA
jgi:drug/metabolite transporter (DMT)-like permease